MRLEKKGYELRDISIVPKSSVSTDNIGSIMVQTPICGRRVLPIFVAPSESVTNERNYTTWLKNGGTPVLPCCVGERISLEERLNIAEDTFVALSYDDAVEISCYEIPPHFKKKYIYIDVQNGHLRKVMELCRRLKDVYKDKIELMVGGVANADAYKYMLLAGVSYIRLSIGGEMSGVVSETMGIHYPLATLIDDFATEKKHLWSNGAAETYDQLPKIVVDGGIYRYDDIIKALALGADAVMLGRMFAECYEACSRLLYCKSEEDFLLDTGYCEDELDSLTDDELDSLTPYRYYIGTDFSTAPSMKIMPEVIEVKHDVMAFLMNLTGYLRTAMHYCGSDTLLNFANNTKFIING